MRTFFARLSDPAMLPELPKLQVRVPVSVTAVPGMGLEHVASLYWVARLPSPAVLPELPELHVGGKLLRG